MWPSQNTSTPQIGQEQRHDNQPNRTTKHKKLHVEQINIHVKYNTAPHNSSSNNNNNKNNNYNNAIITLVNFKTARRISNI